VSAPLDFVKRFAGELDEVGGRDWAPRVPCSWWGHSEGEHSLQLVVRRLAAVFTKLEGLCVAHLVALLGTVEFDQPVTEFVGRPLRPLFEAVGHLQLTGSALDRVGGDRDDVLEVAGSPEAFDG
jgi:hypothetical protein